MRLLLVGANGKMCQVISKLLKDDMDMSIVAGIDHSTVHANPYPVYQSPFELREEVDLIIDFSHPSYLNDLLVYAKDKKLPIVIATTGYNEEQLNHINVVSQFIPILQSSNMSLGINILRQILKDYGRLLGDNFDIEIIEKHHNKKIDAPSGTAILLADTINDANQGKYQYNNGRVGEMKRNEEEIGIHAIRGGTIPGEHTVIFSGYDEVIEMKHMALSKEIFAKGAIKAAVFLIKQKAGYYTMEDIFK